MLSASINFAYTNSWRLTNDTLCGQYPTSNMLAAHLASVLLWASSVLAVPHRPASWHNWRRQQPPASDPAPLPPLLDPIYAAPNNIDLAHPGQIFRRRDIQTPVVINASVAHAEQVVYRTTNTLNQSSWSMVTILTPTAKPNGTDKILSIQLYEDSANLNCAPSQWVLQGDQADMV